MRQQHTAQQGTTYFDGGSYTNPDRVVTWNGQLASVSLSSFGSYPIGVYGFNFGGPYTGDNITGIRAVIRYTLSVPGGGGVPLPIYFIRFEFGVYSGGSFSSRSDTFQDNLPIGTLTTKGIGFATNDRNQTYSVSELTDGTAAIKATMFVDDTIGAGHTFEIDVIRGLMYWDNGYRNQFNGPLASHGNYP